MTDPKATEARHLALSTILAAVDGRDHDLHELVDDADRDSLAVAVGGLALAVSDVISVLSPGRRAALRGHLAALRAGPDRVAGMTPDEQQRLLLGLLLAVHDSDEAGFTALLDGLPRAHLRAVTLSLAEMVVGGQLATEDPPGSARNRATSSGVSVSVGRDFGVFSSLTTRRVLDPTSQSGP